MLSINEYAYEIGQLWGWALLHHLLEKHLYQWSQCIVIGSEMWLVTKVNWLDKMILANRVSSRNLSWEIKKELPKSNEVCLWKIMKQDCDWRMLWQGVGREGTRSHQRKATVSERAKSIPTWSRWKATAGHQNEDLSQPSSLESFWI